MVGVESRLRKEYREIGREVEWMRKDRERKEEGKEKGEEKWY